MPILGAVQFITISSCRYPLSGEGDDQARVNPPTAVEISFDTTNGLTVKYNSVTIFNNQAIRGSRCCPAIASASARAPAARWRGRGG